MRLDSSTHVAKQLRAVGPEIPPEITSGSSQIVIATSRMDPSAAAAVTQTMKLTARRIQLHVHAALNHKSGKHFAAGLKEFLSAIAPNSFDDILLTNTYYANAGPVSSGVEMKTLPVNKQILQRKTE
jgi:hypothetical protein